MAPEEFQPLKKAFLKHKWGWKESVELFKNISVSAKGNMHLYNYNDSVLVERNNPVISRCRGIVVDTNGNVLNYPFDRFFNEFEEEAAEIDWKSAIIEEKIDGSLICLFWNGNKWEITTRGSFYPNMNNPETEFHKWFLGHFPEENLEILEKNVCYMFELVSKNNRIVKWYDEEFSALVGARDLNTMKELESAFLDFLAEKLKVKRPIRYKAENISDCKRL